MTAYVLDLQNAPAPSPEEATATAAELQGGLVSRTPPGLVLPPDPYRFERDRSSGGGGGGAGGHHGPRFLRTEKASTRRPEDEWIFDAPLRAARSLMQSLQGLVGQSPEDRWRNARPKIYDSAPVKMVALHPRTQEYAVVAHDDRIVVLPDKVGGGDVTASGGGGGGNARRHLSSIRIKDVRCLAWSPTLPNLLAIGYANGLALWRVGEPNPAVS